MAKHKLVDLAGTAVHDRIVPELLAYFSANGADYLSRPDADSEALDIVRRVAGEEKFATRQEVVDFMVSRVKARDLDSTHLYVMGCANHGGFDSGELQAEAFEDVPGAFENWKQNNQGIWIYSNGSAREQKKILETTTQGDLNPPIKGYFDTNQVGKKTESESYRRICDKLDLTPCSIVFLSDRVEELDAAYHANMNVVLVKRPGNKDQPANDYKAVTSFSQVN